MYNAALPVPVAPRKKKNYLIPKPSHPILLTFVGMKLTWKEWRSLFFCFPHSLCIILVLPIQSSRIWDSLLVVASFPVAPSSIISPLRMSIDLLHSRHAGLWLLLSCLWLDRGDRERRRRVSGSDRFSFPFPDVITFWRGLSKMLAIYIYLVHHIWKRQPRKVIAWL